MAKWGFNCVDNGGKYCLHHTASMRGYVSRRSEGVVKPYSGRYGSGYIVIRPRHDTTRYVYVDYYINSTD